MALVFAASSIPSDRLVKLPGRSDLAIHATEYAILGALLARALLGRGIRHAALAAALLGAAYGATDELHQLLVPGRTCAWDDWAADSAGSIAGAWLMAAHARRRLTASAREAPAGSSPRWRP